MVISVGVKRQILCIVLSLFSALSVANAADGGYVWPPFPTPEKAEVSWVAEQMVYNNIPEQIRIMESRLPPAEVVKFYHKLWTQDNHPVTGNSFEPGTFTLSQISGPFLFTAQIHAVKTGSESILTVSRLPEIIDQRMHNGVTKKLGDGFPMLTGSKVLVDMQCFDIGKQNRMILHRNGSSVEDNALYLREQLLLQGWKRTENHIEKNNARTTDGSRALVFRRGNDELTVTLRRNGDYTEIVSNQVELH